ncbi:MAG: hypothetical protein OEZ02_10560, partial [Anaerolineae bacterium]|nr:hypothetical protein [Anaerolineae bacterium]
MMRVLQARALLPLAIAMLLVLGACPNRGGGSSTGQAGGPGVTSGANANYRGPFSLSAHPLSEDSLLHNRRILTTEMNTFAADDLAADPAQSSKL